MKTNHLELLLAQPSYMYLEDIEIGRKNKTWAFGNGPRKVSPAPPYALPINVLRAGNLIRPPSTPLDTPRRMPMLKNCLKIC
jgi:hypothetical protein